MGTVGTDLFIGELPLDVSNCVSAVYSSSPNPNLTFDVFDQSVDLWARNVSSDTGYNKLKAIAGLLDRNHHYVMGDYYVYFSHALGRIDDNDRDIERRKIYKLSLSFTCRLRDLVS